METISCHCASQLKHEEKTDELNEIELCLILFGIGLGSDLGDVRSSICALTLILYERASSTRHSSNWHKFASITSRSFLIRSLLNCIFPSFQSNRIGTTIYNRWFQSLENMIESIDCHDLSITIFLLCVTCESHERIPFPWFVANQKSKGKTIHKMIDLKCLCEYGRRRGGERT